MEPKIVRMSPEGQLHVEEELRKKLGFQPNDEFVSFGRDDYVVFKKIDFPPLEEEFREVTKETIAMARERGITEEDVQKEIEAMRSEKR